MKARWKTLAVGALVPALVTGGIAVAQRDGEDSQGERDGARAEKRGEHRGHAGMRLLRNLTYAELHIREGGRDKVVRVEKGRLESATADAVRIRENDGRTVTVAVDRGTRVFGGFGFDGDVTDLRKGRMVIAVHEGDKPATLVAAQPRKRDHRRFGMRDGDGPGRFGMDDDRDGPPGGFPDPDGDR